MFESLIYDGWDTEERVWMGGSSVKGTLTSCMRVERSRALSLLSCCSQYSISVQSNFIFSR